MSAASAPFGFVAARHPSGETRMNRYPIASGYATNMFKGQPVILNTNGTITVGTSNADIIGVLAGVEYVNTAGRPTVDNNWIGGTVATQAYAWVYDDPLTEFLVQADGPVLATALGDQADVSNVGNSGNGMSQATLSATLAGAGVQAQFRIIGFDLSVDNLPGDAFTKVMVRIARHQYVAAKTAI